MYKDVTLTSNMTYKLLCAKCKQIVSFLHTRSPILKEYFNSIEFVVPQLYCTIHSSMKGDHET